MSNVPSMGQPEQHKKAVHRRGAESAEISAENGKNRLLGRVGIQLFPGWRTEEEESAEKYEAAA
jgi:hypothetical protein